MKEMWEFLVELYSGLDNHNKAYDVVRSCLGVKKGDKPLLQYYADFKKTFEELRVLFFAI